MVADGEGVADQRLEMFRSEVCEILRHVDQALLQRNRIKSGSPDRGGDRRDDSPARERGCDEDKILADLRAGGSMDRAWVDATLKQLGCKMPG